MKRHAGLGNSVLPSKFLHASELQKTIDLTFDSFETDELVEFSNQLIDILVSILRPSTLLLCLHFADRVFT